MFKLNVNIIYGENSLAKLPEILKDYGFTYPGILCDKNVYSNSNYVREQIDQLLPHRNNLLFYDFPFEPSYQFLDKKIADIREKELDKKVDVWIGLGGGSTIDTAKGIAVLCNNDGPSINYKGFPTAINVPIPIIAIPSTTGTGSEVVYNASFIDEDTKIKMGINFNKNYPILAILDPRIPSCAPLQVLASSGCDALVHTLESFMSKETNEHVRMFAKRSYELIMANMKPLLMGEQGMDKWLNMQWAAVYAMFALSNSTSGPTGALSYYLGAHYKVSHGIAGGVFIGKVIEYNHNNGYYDLSLLYEGNNQDELNDDKKSKSVINEIKELLELANIPEELAVFGVKESDYNGFNEFARQAKAAFEFNPVPIDLNCVSKLLIK